MDNKPGSPCCGAEILNDVTITDTEFKAVRYCNKCKKPCDPKPASSCEHEHEDCWARGNKGTAHIDIHSKKNWSICPFCKLEPVTDAVDIIRTILKRYKNQTDLTLDSLLAITNVEIKEAIEKERLKFAALDDAMAIQRKHAMEEIDKLKAELELANKQIVLLKDNVVDCHSLKCPAEQERDALRARVKDFEYKIWKHEQTELSLGKSVDDRQKQIETLKAERDRYLYCVREAYAVLKMYGPKGVTLELLEAALTKVEEK